MSDDWGLYANDWDEQPGTKAYARAAFLSLRSILDRCGIELNDARVVDFGCGTGLLTEHLLDAGAAVVAVDTSPAMLAMLEAKADQQHWTNITMSSEVAEVPPDNDVIVCSSVCSFLDDYPATAAQLTGLLRPGGLFVQWDWEREAEGSGLTRDEVFDALHRAGLEGVEVKTAFEVEANGETMQPLVGHGLRPAQ